VDLLVAAYTRAEGDPFNTPACPLWCGARLAVRSAPRAAACRARDRKFISVLPRPDDYLVTIVSPPIRCPTRAMPGDRPCRIATRPHCSRIIVTWHAAGWRRRFGGRIRTSLSRPDRGTLADRAAPRAEAPLTVAGVHSISSTADIFRRHALAPVDTELCGSGWRSRGDAGAPGGGFVRRDEYQSAALQTGASGWRCRGLDTGGSQYSSRIRRSRTSMARIRSSVG